mmetsp:Transcript_24117/g.61341  ORF Transcript_24117/g.61341 Transcript_24117/m.61341 type:complete len:135 (+) Transcript_24117:2-406(+)
MKLTSRLRSEYLASLRRPEFAELVVLQEERLTLREFLSLVSRHKFVLSPPGRGYDCFRTWQAIALGTTPMVVNDPRFDQRLHNHGCGWCPLPADLTASNLQDALEAAPDPAVSFRRVLVQEWAREWSNTDAQPM